MSIFGVNSIHQSHPKFIVPYKINMKPLKLPKFRPKFERTETRSRTREKLKIHQEYQDSSININSIPEEKNEVESQQGPTYPLNREKSSSPKRGLKAAATLVAKQSTVIATKLLTIKKKASPPLEK